MAQGNHTTSSRRKKITTTARVELASTAKFQLGGKGDQDNETARHLSTLQATAYLLIRTGSSTGIEVQQHYIRNTHRVEYLLIIHVPNTHKY